MSKQLISDEIKLKIEESIDERISEVGKEIGNIPLLPP